MGAYYPYPSTAQLEDCPVPGKSCVTTYKYRDHAWTNDQYDMSNGTSWKEDSRMNAYYPYPDAPAASSFAQKLTYPSKDTASWIEPYKQRDHAWSHDDYDMTNQTSWKEDSHMAAYWPYPTFAEKQTYPSKDTASWIEPYKQRDHAWSHDDYDMTNQTSWKEDSHMAAYWPYPTLAEKQTYPSKDTASWIEPYKQRDHAWSHDDYDMTNQTSWKEDSHMAAYWPYPTLAEK